MIESSWDLLCDITGERMATGRYPARYEAMKEAQRHNPPLDATPPGVKPTVTGNAEQQLNAMAKQIAAARNITFSQAYVQAMAENPHLHRAYLEQHSH